MSVAPCNGGQRCINMVVAAMGNASFGAFAAVRVLGTDFIGGFANNTYVDSNVGFYSLTAVTGCVITLEKTDDV